MYKDVWKKFGGKILIVVCSVLLLGGVAFAAPRLRAEESIEKVDFSKVNFSESETDTPNTIYIKNKEKFFLNFICFA